MRRINMARALTFTSTDISYPLYDLVKGTVAKHGSFLAALAQLLNGRRRVNKRREQKRKRKSREHTGHRLSLSLSPHTVAVGSPKPEGSVAVGVRVTVHGAKSVVYGGLAEGDMKTTGRRRRMRLRCGLWWVCYVGMRRGRALLFTMNALFEFAICLGVAVGEGLVKSCEKLRVRSPLGPRRFKYGKSWQTHRPGDQALDGRYVRSTGKTGWVLKWVEKGVKYDLGESSGGRLRPSS